jgi:acyl-CoA synthetase (AMP-forming)/AMP-acid ligase II
MNVGMLLDIATQIDPERVVATDRDGRSTTLGLRSRAQTFARRLREHPPGPVAFIDVNSAHVAVALFGSAYACRAFAPLNFRSNRQLIEDYLELLEPAIVVAGARYADLIPAGRNVMAVESLADVVDPDDIDDASDEQVAVTIFTSGTTAAPKPAGLRHRQLMAYVLGSTEPMSEPPDSATLIAAPNYHIAMIANVLTSVYAGRRMVLLDQFSPETWLELARTENVTHAFVVPTMLQAINDELAAGAEPPEKLLTLAYGGSAAPRATVESALAQFRPSTGFVNAYGLTETSSTVSILSPDDHVAAFTSSDPEVRARLGSVGRPLPGIELRIAEDGEILVRGPQVAGAEEHAADWWFQTGDLGRTDSDGYLFITGRKDDMIIRGGENISPVEVEDAIRRSPEVEDVAVVGVSDERWGQRIMAAVELRADISESELSGRLVDVLPSFKRPDRIVIVAELPRTDLGKVQRRKVRAAFEAGAGS